MKIVFTEREKTIKTCLLGKSGALCCTNISNAPKNGITQKNLIIVRVVSTMLYKNSFGNKLGIGFDAQVDRVYKFDIGYESIQSRFPHLQT